MSINRRSFLTHSALVAAVSLAPLSLSRKTSANGSIGQSRVLKLNTYINGREVSRDSVLQWEARRIQVVADRMKKDLPGMLVGELGALLLRPAVSTTHIFQERQRLADAKMRAGDSAMRQLVAPDLAITTLASQLSIAVPLGWSVCEIQLVSNRGTAERFAEWFKTKILRDDQRAMLIACPDHYVLHPAFRNGQDVIETTGGAILASHFVIDYDKTGNLPIVTHSDYPVRFSGAAVNDFGMVIGGTNHQFRTLTVGFESRPKIFFPRSLPPTMISEHRWHLACEFSNWITAYIEETGDY